MKSQGRDFAPSVIGSSDKKYHLFLQTMACFYPYTITATVMLLILLMLSRGNELGLKLED